VYTLVQDLDSAKTNLPSKSHDYKASVFRPSPSFQPHRFSTQAPSHRDDIKGKNFKRDNWNKGPDSSGVSSTTKCYKCQGYGHLAASCPTLVKITIIDGTPTEATESDSDEYTHHSDVTDDESSGDDVGLNCIRPTPSTHLAVVKCVPSPPAKKVDWRRTATFHTFTKIGYKSCQMIVDSESYINAISSRFCENLGLEIIPHLYPLKVSWIDSTAFKVKQRCLVQVNFNHYKNKIWCDVITMNESQVILGRPWLFDKNVTFTVDLTCVNLSMRVSRLSYYHWDPRLDSPRQTSTLALLPTPSFPPLIATVPSLFLINHTYHVRKSLPPLLSTSSHYKVFEFAPTFASHKHVYRDQWWNKWSNVNPTP